MDRLAAEAQSMFEETESAWRKHAVAEVARLGRKVTKARAAMIATAEAYANAQAEHALAADRLERDS